MPGDPMAARRLKALGSDDAQASADPFLDGPIPRRWLRIAARLPGKSFNLAVMIWCAASMAGSRTVTISNVDALGFGLERNAKYRALAWLEDANLIAVERKPGRSPIVTLLDARATRDGA